MRRQGKASQRIQRFVDLGVLWEKRREAIGDLRIAPFVPLKYHGLSGWHHGIWLQDPEPIAPGGVRLDSIGLELPLAEVYGGTHLG